MPNNDNAFALKPIEIECGVTLPQVAEMAGKALLLDDGRLAVFPEYSAAALCSSTARYLFGKPAEFAGMNTLGMPTYRPAAG